MDGGDADVCVISRTIDGRLFVLVVENPGVLAVGRSLPVGDPGCVTPARCDDARDRAVVDVQIDTGERRRAAGGTLDLSVVEPAMRYAGGITLRLPDGGALSGQFDLVPRPED
jgi:hypothetical protein